MQPGSRSAGVAVASDLAGFAVASVLLAGALADALGLAPVVWAGAALTLASSVWAAARLRETRIPPARAGDARPPRASARVIA